MPRLSSLEMKINKLRLNIYIFIVVRSTVDISRGMNYAYCCRVGSRVEQEETTVY